MALLNPDAIVSRVRVMEDSNLLYLIFSYLDPASVKEAVLVSRKWRDTILSASGKFWRWALLRVDPWQFPSQSEDLLSSRILSIVPEIRISPSAGPNILRSLLKAIRKGETKHLKKMTSHLYNNPTLVSSAIVQLEECVITGSVQFSDLLAILARVAASEDSKLRELAFQGSTRRMDMDSSVMVDALVKLKTIGYDLGSLELSDDQVTSLFSRIRESQDLRLTELHPYWDVSRVPSDLFAGALSRLERVTLASWTEVTPSQLDSLFMMLISKQAEVEGSTPTMKELMLSSTDVTSVSPEVLVGAIQNLEEVAFWSGKMTAEQVTGILTMVKENRQGSLKKIELIGPEVGGSVSATLIEEAKVNTSLVWI